MRSPRFPLASAPSPHVLLALDLHEKHPIIAFDVAGLCYMLCVALLRAFSDSFCYHIVALAWPEHGRHTTCRVPFVRHVREL